MEYGEGGLGRGDIVAWGREWGFMGSDSEGFRGFRKRDLGC